MSWCGLLWSDLVLVGWLLNALKTVKVSLTDGTGLLSQFDLLPH